MAATDLAALAPFPETAPFDVRMMPVDQGHALYVEQVGDPAGIPAVFLHGGPGSGCQPSHRRLFDPQRFRAVLFDQRGSGRSTPKRRLDGNRLSDLIGDMERIREALGIKRWLVVGGSWGALLATAYAEAHPERVTGMVLRAVFLGGADEVEWAFRRGPRIFYPDLWQVFVALLPAAERDEPLATYGARLASPDPAVHGPAAHAWHDFEQALSVLTPRRPALPRSLDDPALATGSMPNTPFVEWHYFRNGCFLEPGQLLGAAARLRGIPGVIVQGRYDLLCPPAGAHALAQAWPGSELRLIEASGHSLAEPAIAQAVLQAIHDIGRRLA